MVLQAQAPFPPFPATPTQTISQSCSPTAISPPLLPPFSSNEVYCLMIAISILRRAIVYPPDKRQK
jgi:hypothetical protein